MNSTQGPTQTANRSEPLEALALQAEVAEATGCFVFTHRCLDKTSAASLGRYLREACKARFVDLSSLGRWNDVSAAAAEALQNGLRNTRSLILDGNDLGQRAGELEAWCCAIRDHPGLQHLSLRNTGLDDHSAMAIAKALHRHAVLFSVDMGLNRFGDAAVAALADAVGESHVILEVNVGGCHANIETCSGLSAVLERNHEQFRGRGGKAKVLLDLRRARAEAATSIAHFSASLPLAAATAATPRMPLLPTPMPPSVVAAALDRGASFFDKPPEASPGADVEVGGPDHVFFDAPEQCGVTAELCARIDACWRYSATDRELLLELRQRMDDMKAHRRQERARAEEVIQRVTGSMSAWQEQLRPSEDRLINLREELGHVTVATKTALQQNIREKMSLREAQEELKVASQACYDQELSSAKLASDLKNRNWELHEQIASATEMLRALEASIENTAADNERCRRLLHAARFETETERFVLPSIEAAGRRAMLEAQAPVACRP